MILPISLVIPTMNRPESLVRTLDFIAKGKDVPAQVVVVDQSQNIELQNKNQEVLNGFSGVFSQINYEYQEVPSLTKARNRGLEAVKNEIVVLADDDIDVNAETISNVYEIFHDSKIAMIAGIDELTSKSSTNIGYILGTKSIRNRKIGHVTKSMLGRYPDCINGQIETQWAQGYFFAVRKSLMDKWQCRWDENLTSYAYAEDLDFSFNYYKHAKAEGLKCVLDSRVSVKHLATLEFRIPSEKSIYMYIVNRVYLSHKHKMGFYGNIASAWCNFWRLVQNVVSRQQPGVIAKAWLASIKYHKEIIEGNLDYDKFMK